MKKVLMALLILGSAAAHAETELSCWNIYSKKGSQPVMKATIAQGNVLTVSMNFDDSTFDSYNYDIPVYDGHKTGALTQPAGNIAPSVIETSSSPYNGDNSYDMQIGGFSYDSTSYKNNGAINARLVLPQDLSADALANFRIRNASERSNAVIIMDPAGSVDQSGSTYLRMFCVSK